MRSILLATLILGGCASVSVKSLSEDYEVIKGTLAAPPQFGEGNDRLFIYLKREEKIEEKETILVAVAENTEKKRVLQELAKRLNESPNEAIYLYGVQNDGTWNEYVSGINFIIYAAGVYVPQTKQYQIVLTDFGERSRDALTSASWGGFVKLLGKAALKAL